MNAHQSRVCPRCGGQMRAREGGDRTICDRVLFVVECPSCLHEEWLCVMRVEWLRDWMRHGPDS